MSLERALFMGWPSTWFPWMVSLGRKAPRRNQTRRRYPATSAGKVKPWSGFEGRLKRQQEGEERGLLVPSELAKRLARGGCLSVMSQDGIRHIGGAAIMQQPAAHAESPKR